MSRLKLALVMVGATVLALFGMTNRARKAGEMAEQVRVQEEVNRNVRKAVQTHNDISALGDDDIRERMRYKWSRDR